MSRWETTSTLDAEVPPAEIWKRAYANAEAWPQWNAEIKRARLNGPLALGAEAKIVFGTGLRLRFHVVEYEDGRLFTDESRLPGARMGHRHLVEPIEKGGSRLTNTIYIEGPLSSLWRRIMGPASGANPARCAEGGRRACHSGLERCLAGGRHHAGDRVTDEARLLVAFDLEGEAGDHLMPAAALLVDRDDLGLGADLGVDGDRGGEADLVPAVVDAEGEAAGRRSVPCGNRRRGRG